jgi:hypothetical protein
MRNIKINLTLDLGQLPQRKMEDNYCLTGVTISERIYFEITEYAKQFENNSVATVRRKLKKVEHHRCNDFFVRILNKYFVSPSLNNLSNEHYSKLIELKGNLATYLTGFEWDYIGCVRFASCLKQLTVKHKMEKMFELLTKKYKSASVRMFYVCEKNKENNGYHSHFVIQSKDIPKTNLKSFIENHFRGKANGIYANTKIEKYDPNLGGIPYMLKELHLNCDGYDFPCKNMPDLSRQLAVILRPTVHHSTDYKADNFFNYI